MLFSMDAFKAPSPNGMHVIFYQSKWEVMSDFVYIEISKLFDNLSHICQFNEMSLVMISKIDIQENMT